MGFYENDRIRHKNAAFSKVESGNVDDGYSSIDLRISADISLSDIVQAIVGAGFSIKLDTNNRVIINNISSGESDVGKVFDDYVTNGERLHTHVLK